MRHSRVLGIGDHLQDSARSGDDRRVSPIFYLTGWLMMNTHLSLGRFALCLNNPQYHRIHHSVEPQHRDKNFCKLLPLFDVIFGTAWKPGKDEFTMTGLVPREQAVQRMNRLLLQTGENTARLIPRI